MHLERSHLATIMLAFSLVSSCNAHNEEEPLLHAPRGTYKLLEGFGLGTRYNYSLAALCGLVAAVAISNLYREPCSTSVGYLESCTLLNLPIATALSCIAIALVLAPQWHYPEYPTSIPAPRSTTHRIRGTTPMPL